MGYDKTELERLSIEAIKQHNLIFINEIMTFIPCCSATFYNLELEKLESIKKALNDNRVNIKRNIRSRWYESENVTAEIMLYKLTADEEELRRLSVTKNEHTGNEGKPIGSELNFTNFTNEQLAELERLAKLASDPKGTE